MWIGLSEIVEEANTDTVLHQVVKGSSLVEMPLVL